jgi:hypothetical protein
MGFVPRLTIVPTPSPQVVLTQYDGALFPKFKLLFEKQDESSPLRHLSLDPEEASVALVLENKSGKAITALRWRWQKLDSSGKVRSNTCASDSYMVDVFRAVVGPDSRRLLGPSANLDESIIEHVLNGGGVIGAKAGGSSFLENADELTFAIDLILFADGEIAGPDPERYALELQLRKPAAEFVAKHIRLAHAENRDAAPVLSALAELPSFVCPGYGRHSSHIYWIRHYATQYLRHWHGKVGEPDRREVGLRHLENRPELPKFYRK